MMKVGDRVRVLSTGTSGVITAHEANEHMPWVVMLEGGVKDRRFHGYEIENVYKFKPGDAVHVTSGGLVGMSGTIDQHGRTFDWICKDSKGYSFAVDEKDLTLRPEVKSAIVHVGPKVEFVETGRGGSQRASESSSVPDGFLNPLPIDMVDTYSEQTITVRTVRRMLLAGGAEIFQGEVKHVCAGPEKLVRVNVRSLL